MASGFWVMAKDTGRFLFCHRSPLVPEPNSWGIPSGKIEKNELPIEAAKRELKEETGYHGEIEFTGMSVLEVKKLKFWTFLGVVPYEFTPILNNESQGYIWTTLDNLPHPLHPGIKWTLKNDYEFLTNIQKQKPQQI